jgi:hypothetical protein
MYRRFCANPACRRLVCDVEDKSMVPDVLYCQHCGRKNVLRHEVKPKEKPKPKTAREGRKGVR